MIMVRKEIKDYGTKKTIEGIYKKGDRCIIIEDVITSGISLIETINSIENAGLIVDKIIVIVDREQGGLELIKSKGYNIDYLFNLSTLQANDKITQNTYSFSPFL